MGGAWGEGRGKNHNGKGSNMEGEEDMVPIQGCV